MKGAVDAGGERNHRFTCESCEAHPYKNDSMTEILSPPLPLLFFIVYRWQEIIIESTVSSIVFQIYTAQCRTTPPDSVRKDVRCTIRRVDTVSIRAILERNPSSCNTCPNEAETKPIEIL